jgi:hypothetical protein
MLEHESDHVAVEVAVRRLGDRYAVHLNRARTGAIEIADDREQRGLAGARGPGEHHELTGLEGQRDAIDGDDRPGVHASHVLDHDARPADVIGVSS